MKPLTVSSARDLGPQFVDNPHRMVGQDGAYSIPLGNGEALWYFGDTLIGERPAESLWYIFGEPVGGTDMAGKGPFDDMITNTGLILRNRTGRHGLTDFGYILNDDGTLKQLVPALPSEDRDRDRIWCMNGCLLGDKLYLFWMKVLMHEKGGDPFPVGFEVIGTGLAVGSRKDWKFTRIKHNGDSLLWPSDQPQFAAAVLNEPDQEYLYLYGSLQGSDHMHRAYLARVSREEIEDLSAYEYFAGDADAWSTNVYEATPLFDNMPNEMSVSYNPHLGGYLAVHSLGLTGDIVGRTSSTPWGPWSDDILLWRVPPPENPPPYPRLVYAGKEHPEISEDDGRVIYVTYIEFEEYYPHLVEVTLG